MKILYIHGFGSRVDPESEKYKALSTLGDVFAVAPDYSLSFAENIEKIRPLLIDKNLLVGTSMGGCMVSHLAEISKLPFVAINPVLFPRRTLMKYLGTRFDYYGNPYTLTEVTARSYPVFCTSASGLVLLDLGDEVIDSTETLNCLEGVIPVRVFEGGNHRFAHIKESLDLITEFFNCSTSGSVSTLDARIAGFDQPETQKLTVVLNVNAEDEDINCPVCGELLLAQMPPDMDEPVEMNICDHVRFVFLDAYADPFDLDQYEFLHVDMRDWLQLSEGRTDESNNDRESDVLLTCPIVNFALVDKPLQPAPYYRVIWGISDQ